MWRASVSLDRFDRIDPEPAFAAAPEKPGLIDVTPEKNSAETIAERAAEAAAFLKALSHEGRLMILCHLAVQERSVTELEALLGSRQAAVSQQLARLRLEGLVATRRDGKAIIYSIRDPRVLQQIQLLQGMFGVA
jgi:DNA-binding transcriptional ArsR family regulator